MKELEAKMYYEQILNNSYFKKSYELYIDNLAFLKMFQ